MNKRGQFTLFVVLGIVLVIIVALVYVFRGNIASTYQEITGGLAVPSEVAEVQDAVEVCVGNAVPTGLHILGAQGGYFILPELRYSSPVGGDIAYAYYDGEKELLSYEELLSEYESYLSLAIPTCLSVQDFSPLLVEPGDLSVTLDAGDTLQVTVDYPVIVINQNGDAYTLADPYVYEEQINLPKLYAGIDTIVDSLVENPEDDNYQLYLSTGYQVAIIPTEQDIVVYSVTDPLAIVGDSPYVFFFATYYPFAEAP